MISLSDNAPLITALGNDIDYADVFVEQLKMLLTSNDVVIAMSGSGASLRRHRSSTRRSPS